MIDFYKKKKEEENVIHCQGQKARFYFPIFILFHYYYFFHSKLPLSIMNDPRHFPRKQHFIACLQCLQQMTCSIFTCSCKYIYIYICSCFDKMCNDESSPQCHTDCRPHVLLNVLSKHSSFWPVAVNYHSERSSQWQQDLAATEHLQGSQTLTRADSEPVWGVLPCDPSLFGRDCVTRSV